MMSLRAHGSAAKERLDMQAVGNIFIGLAHTSIA